MGFCGYPDTSRKPKKSDRESRMYAFTSRSKMETDIKNGRYLEHGEYDGNLYGIKIDSIHEVVEAGRVCILDANPQVCTSTTINTTGRSLAPCCWMITIKNAFCERTLIYYQHTIRHRAAVALIFFLFTGKLSSVVALLANS